LRHYFAINRCSSSERSGKTALTLDANCGDPNGINHSFVAGTEIAPNDNRKENTMLAFHCNEEVAVMPSGASSPMDVLQIARVAAVSRTFIRTNEQRIYAVHDGRDFSRQSGRYIVPATEEHRAAIRRKSHWSTSLSDMDSVDTRR
jgi:hypothetical protein